MNTLLDKVRAAAHRGKAFRRDDRAQVMVLTAVMAFVTVIMAIYTTNASIMLFDRVVGQNAVDAAADSFAAYQARGLNLTQHLNDVHYGVNIAAFSLETASLVVRIACPAMLLTTFPVPNWPGYRSCCQIAHNVADGIDNVQDAVSDAILVIQDVINVVFPILATLSANDLARVNGADNLLTVAGEVIDNFINMFGDTGGVVADAVAAVGDYVPVYAFPLQPDQIIDLGMERKDPDYLFWDDVKILYGLGIASDIACALTGDIMMLDEPNDGIGWEEDEYYCGGPAANTWIAGKKRRTVLPKLVKMPWLTPKMDEPEQVAGLYSFDDDYATFQGRNFGTSSTDDFENPAFFTIASCQVGGKVVVDRTILNDDFDSDTDYGVAELITVQVPFGIDPKVLMIWH